MLHNKMISQLVTHYVDFDTLSTLEITSKSLSTVVREHQKNCYKRQPLETRTQLKSLDKFIKHMAAKRVFMRSKKADKQIDLLVKLTSVEPAQRAAVYTAETKQVLSEGIDAESFTDAFAAALAFEMATDFDTEKTLYFYNQLHYYGNSGMLFLQDINLLTFASYSQHPVVSSFGISTAPLEEFVADDHGFKLLRNKTVSVKDASSMRNVRGVLSVAFLQLIENKLISFAFIAAVCRNASMEGFVAAPLTHSHSIAALKKYKDAIAAIDVTTTPGSNKAANVYNSFLLFSHNPAKLDESLASKLLKQPVI